MSLSRADISAIAAEVVRQLAPMLAGGAGVSQATTEPSGADVYRLRQMAINDLAEIRARKARKQAAKGATV